MKKKKKRDHSPGNRVLWSQFHNLKAWFKQRSDLKAFQVLSLLSKLPGSCLHSQGSWASRMLVCLLWSSATNCSSPRKAEIKHTHLSDLVMHFHESLVINYKARALKTWAEAWQALLSDLSFAFKRCEYQWDPSLGLTGSTSSLPDMKIFLFLSSVCVGGWAWGVSCLKILRHKSGGQRQQPLLSLFCIHILEWLEHVSHCIFNFILFDYIFPF